MQSTKKPAQIIEWLLQPAFGSVAGIAPSAFTVNTFWIELQQRLNEFSTFRMAARRRLFIAALIPSSAAFLVIGFESAIISCY